MYLGSIGAIALQRNKTAENKETRKVHVKERKVRKRAGADFLFSATSTSTPPKFQNNFVGKAATFTTFMSLRKLFCTETGL